MERLRPRRLLILAGFDALAWVAGFVLYVMVRQSGGLPVALSHALEFGAATALLHVVLGFTVRLHHGRAALGTFEEMMLLGSVTVAAGAIVTVTNVVARLGMPRGVPVAATAIALVLMAWGRAVYRRTKQSSSTHTGVADGQIPALVARSR